MMKLLALLFLCSFSGWAQEPAFPRAPETESNYNEAEDIRQGDRERLLRDFDIQKIDANELNNFPEIYLERQSIIQNKDRRTGIYQEPHFTQTDDSRFALGYGLSQDYQNPMKVQTIYGSYLNKINNFYQEMWWGFQVKRVQAQFDAIHDDPETGGRNQNMQGITTVGLGVAHNFHAMADIFRSDRVFETVAVYLNYNYYLDSTDDQQYQGYGYTADYSLAYRSTDRLFYGGKFSYNWALVERPEENNEPLSARSLVFGWTSISFEFGFYY